MPKAEELVLPHVYKAGRATEMLEESVRKLKVDDEVREDKFREEVNRVLSTMLLKAQMKETAGELQVAEPIIRRTVSPPLPPPPPTLLPMEAELVTVNDGCACDCFPTPPPLETEFDFRTEAPVKMESSVVRRRNSTKQKGLMSAGDRRSYIEKKHAQEQLPPSSPPSPPPPPPPPPALTQQQASSDTSIHLSTDNSHETEPQSIANNLVDGKHPVCCVCDLRITR